jgi:ribokinase
MADILVVGSANIDLSLGLAHLPKPGETVLAGDIGQMIGGKGVNQAVAAARAGSSVAMVACVGRDGHGQTIRTALETEGIVTKHVSWEDGPTGLAIVMTALGDNMIAVAPGTNALLRPAALEPGMFAEARLVLCQFEIPLETTIKASKIAREAGAVFILDPAPGVTLPNELLENVDWLTPNESEARILLKQPDGAIEPAEAAAKLIKMGASNVLLKLGSRGSLLQRSGHQPVPIAAYDVDAVDTTAAGDAFNGAFAVALNEGASGEDAARFASAASALAVTRRGAGDAMAYRSEIDRLLASSERRVSPSS